MTSPPVDDPQTLRRILGQAEALFLDFDGPICNLFAGFPASVVVDQLCVVLADGGYGDPPPEIEKSSDPFDVLRYAATLGNTEAEYVNAAFTAHEVEAVKSAQVTLGAHGLVNAWSMSGRPVAIVSNNSVVAIDAYLGLHGLRGCIADVSGRLDPDPALLKPRPYLIDRALIELGMQAEAAIFIGDSISDIEAAHAAGVMAIGYANKPSKRQLFQAKNPVATVSSMTQLLAVV